VVKRLHHFGGFRFRLQISVSGSGFRFQVSGSGFRLRLLFRFKFLIRMARVGQTERQRLVGRVKGRIYGLIKWSAVILSGISALQYRPCNF